MMQRTAIPRSESNSGKRGLPGGGATAGDGADAGWIRAEAAEVTQLSSSATTRSSRLWSNESSQSRLQFTALPSARASYSSTLAVAERRAAATASIVGAGASRFEEIAFNASSVLFSNRLV